MTSLPGSPVESPKSSEHTASSAFPQFGGTDNRATAFSHLPTDFIIDLANDLRPHLRAIGTLCDRMTGDAEHRPLEFVQKVRQIHSSVQGGLQLLDEACTPEWIAIHNATPRGAIGVLSHDFLNKVNIVPGRCRQLRRQQAEEFSPYRDEVCQVEAEFEAAHQKLTVKLAAIGGTGKSESHAPVSVDNSAVDWSVVQPVSHISMVGPGRILVVDDDADSRSLLRDLLEEMGHNVEEAGNGAEAITCLEECTIDLILLDLHMAGIDGLAVLEDVKNDYALRSIPIIVVSADESDDAIEHCISRGADDFLKKPYKEMLLKARITSCLLKGQVRRNERSLHEEVIEAKQRADALLYKVFPYTIAEELRTGGHVQARGYDNVAVMFCDIVNFTTYCEKRTAREVVHLRCL
jgi:CheY-like chemotaxis protein